MNAEELSKLGPKEKWERIANAHFPQYPTFWEGGELRHKYPGEGSGPALPYLRDADSVRLLEDTLTLPQRNTYVVLLGCLLRVNAHLADGSIPSIWKFLRAEPAQCCDAFLLTVG